MNATASASRHLHFITGKLAAHALREVLEDSSKTLGFSYSIDVVPITVAALMTPRWLLRHWSIPDAAHEVILPGFIGEEIEALQQRCAVPVRVGPKDLRDLPEFLGAKKSSPPDLSRHSVEIIAEINHAPRMTIDALVAHAGALRAAGADVIDVGCQPGMHWDQVRDAVSELVANGHRVSIDSFDPREVALACEAGAELVLSVNGQNVDAAHEWNSEVVAIPDTPDDLDSLYRTIDTLDRREVAFRIDPILEPIGCGLTASLVRYHTVRQRFPDAAMMMGIGNLTELTDVDSAGVNMLLIGICAELRIDSVLTTQVINWARTSVRECDLARRLADYAVRHRRPPKRIDPGLIVLRDDRLKPHPTGTFATLAESIRDPNYRLFAQDDQIHVVSAGIHLCDSDPFRLMDQLLGVPTVRNVDVSHAFYLGFEMAKALTALQLGKQYNQDQPLDWGFLTQAESFHRLRRGRQHPAAPRATETTGEPDGAKADTATSADNANAAPKAADQQPGEET